MQHLDLIQKLLEKSNVDDNSYSSGGYFCIGKNVDNEWILFSFGPGFCEESYPDVEVYCKDKNWDEFMKKCEKQYDFWYNRYK